MESHIEYVVQKATGSLEQKAISELDNLRLLMELTTQQQISEVVKGIRLVITDEVHHHMRARGGEN